MLTSFKSRPRGVHVVASVLIARCRFHLNLCDNSLRQFLPCDPPLSEHGRYGAKLCSGHINTFREKTRLRHDATTLYPAPYRITTTERFHQELCHVQCLAEVAVGLRFSSHHAADLLSSRQRGELKKCKNIFFISGARVYVAFMLRERIKDAQVLNSPLGGGLW